MIVLDTNVISALMQSQPEPKVVEWLNKQPFDSVWTTSIVVFEIRFGLACMPEGKKRRVLESAFDAMLVEDFSGRVLDFDDSGAAHAAATAAKLRAIGRTVEFRDALIAGAVTAHGATLATRNVRHFEHAGVPLVNPWEE